jgi:hypothetical protein
VTGRIAIVAGVIALFIAGRWLYARWRLALQRDDRPHPRLPRHLLDGADRTWVLFTTPLCANCGPVERHLRAFDPAARVVRIDATEDTALAHAFRVRSAPTVLLADRQGDVQARLVGAAAVTDYVRSP